MDDISAGLIVYRASRLEALLDPFLHLLEAHPPAHVLAPQTVIAAHPGMRHWLTAALARRRGPRGIAANLDIVLPSAWLDALARRQLGASAVALEPYQRAHLRWRIHARLPELDAPQVQHYLQGADGARRRFQLADRLARLYSQYVVYRPDWLSAWAAGQDTRPAAGFIGPLWRLLRTEVGMPHRGEWLARLEAALLAPEVPAETEPLHLFGVSHVAPAELAVLRAVARHRPVVLYVPDPCRAYWAGLRSDRAMLRERVRADAAGHDTEALFLEQGHPLLAAWGRMGQHFVLALEDSDLQVDVRHWRDEEAAADAPHEAPPGSLLRNLQESIRHGDPTAMAPTANQAAQREDRSLRVHACHTRLRELEVLRDALLREREARPDLKPGDIVVMAPDIQAYVPLLPAVFGEPGVMQGPLPYHLADVAVARSHPLLQAFDQFLDLPTARLTAPEVVDLLRVPDIARRFGLEPADVEQLIAWLGRSRVAWALDAEARARRGLPALDAHTFAWGVDRMLASYVYGAGVEGADDVGVRLPDGSELAPMAGLGGPQAAMLGALDALLVEVAAFCEAARTPRRASEWAARLERQLDACFRLASDDVRGRDARALLLGMVRAVASEPAESGLDPELDYAVVRDVLRERLSAASERQRFLLGGVTFCGMVPQRAIPFRVVAVLGLNDGEFPRAPGGSGLDPMAHDRRLGDRDVRSDDRYLFLETVMSAREVLHLSYVGEGAHDGKPRNPAAPLAELLAALDEHAGLRGDESAERPWHVRHPLQPFDARYFDGGDPRLFSYHAGFADMVARAAPARASFVADPSETVPSLDATADARVAPLQEVMAYFRNPARQLLASGLNLRLDALDEDRLRDEEPMDPRFEVLDGVGRRLFLEAAHAGTALPESPPDWLRLTGLMPLGRSGEMAWQAERDAVAQLLEKVADHPLFMGGLPLPSPQPLDVIVGAYRVQGEARHVHVRDGTHWLLGLHPRRGKEDELGLRERLELFLEWALLRLAHPDPAYAVRACAVTAAGVAVWPANLDDWDAAWRRACDEAPTVAAGMHADLQSRVCRLLDYWTAAREAPRWYFPKTSWAAVQKSGTDAASQQWTGGSQSVGERDYAPGYARLLAGDRDFAVGSVDLTHLAHDAHWLADVLALPVAEGIA
ncbi:exodeoxyribonuclease V subunit gamma [Lysobacter olei]